MHLRNSKESVTKPHALSPAKPHPHLDHAGLGLLASCLPCWATFRNKLPSATSSLSASCVEGAYPESRHFRRRDRSRCCALTGGSYHILFHCARPAAFSHSVYLSGNSVSRDGRDSGLTPDRSSASDMVVFFIAVLMVLFST